MLQKSPEQETSAPAETPDIATVLKKGGSGRSRRRIAVIAAIVLVVLAGGWLALGGGSKSSGVIYTTAPVARGDLTVTVTATGTVEPTNEVEVSSELSGLISSVPADYNDAVKKGDVLATLSTDKLDSAVAVATATQAARSADVEQATVTVSETAGDFQRAKALLDKGAGTQEAYDTAKAASDRAVAALASAKADLDTATANLDIARNDRAKADIVSPIDGVVLSRDVEVGQTVAASLSAPVLFTLADDLAKMELQVDVDEADVGKVAVGNEATFTVAAYSGETFPAKITQVRFAPETVEGVVTYMAILSVDNSKLLLRPGMTASADIVVEQVKDVLTVPNAALRYVPPTTATRQRGAGLLGLLMPRPPGSEANRTTATADTSGGPRTIYVLKNGKPEAVHVTTGSTDGSRTAIVSGDLAEGDKVITGSRTQS